MKQFDPFRKKGFWIGVLYEGAMSVTTCYGTPACFEFQTNRATIEAFYEFYD